MANKDLTEESLVNDFNKLNFSYCQKSADTNDPDGIFWLGYCYEYGIGVVKDENKAFFHYQKSAEMNNSNGMYQVGYCYYLGIGVEIDRQIAFSYCLKSAEAGNSNGIWKTAICYHYGIGVEESYYKYREWIEKEPILSRDSVTSRPPLTDLLRPPPITTMDPDLLPDDPLLVLDVPIRRDSKHGKCAHCNEDNTNRAWCLSCDPDITTRWTSGNKNIDDCMKTLQLRVWKYEYAIEWIPFDRLSDVKKIGEGGFGSVYSAAWSDGIREIKEIEKTYERARKPSSTVALKTLSDSKDDFLKEFESLTKCVWWGSKLKIYGLTQNTKTNEYLMVFQYADNGSLYNFLRKNFRELTWQTKLKLLFDISEDLRIIHDAGYIHADFHSGNILHHKGISNAIQSYISDMGLSKKWNENSSKDCIYGVMPYVAPEVLSGQRFTKAADIYGFGVIMSEVSTGQRPFDGYQFNTELALNICSGLRPEFALKTPECYIELAKMCMDPDPQKRPSAYNVYCQFQRWIESIERLNDEIKKRFLDADKIIRTLPAVSSSHPDHMYTSKIINTRVIAGGFRGYGICGICNQNNTSEAWCQTCDPKMETQGWTSGNENVDNCIKEFQLKALAYTKVIEWIPFNRLKNIRKIGEGGFGSVYFATWSDGIRKIDLVDGLYARTRESSSEVALKTLPCSEESYSLKEFKNHIKCGLMGIKLKVYGLTLNTEINEYMMVAQYADNGDLRQFLRLKFKELTWQTKLKLLVSITEELHDIHYAGYIHRDLHSGNILLDKSMRTYISDLGLSIKGDENVSTGNIYGVMPYVDSEVLTGKQFTPKADIYSFGIIMTEMSTGQRPFDGRKFDTKLALEICIGGLRPEFAPETPKCYIELAKQCVNKNPQIRPNSFNIYNEINDWLNKMRDSDYVNEVIKRKIIYGLDKIKGSYSVDEIKKREIVYRYGKINDLDDLNNIDRIKNYEIRYWLDKIKVSDNVGEIIKQLKYWLDKMNDSEDIDEIKNQINEIKGSDDVNEFVKDEIKCWLDEIKVSDNVDEIIKQLKYWLEKLNNTEDVDKIKKQINDWLNKIKGSDYVNEIIKHKIISWLDEIKISDKVNEIKKHEISCWLGKIKGSDNVKEIKEQIKYWLNKIKGSDDVNVDEIERQINDRVNKLNGSEDIDEIKKQINDRLDQIKGSNGVDEIKKQIEHWLNKIKGSYDVDENKEREIDWRDNIKASDNVDEIIKQLKPLLNKISNSEEINKRINDPLNKAKGLEVVNEIINHEIKISVKIDEFTNQLKWWLDKTNASEDVNEIKKQINDWLDKTKNSYYIIIIKRKIKRWFDEIKVLNKVNEIKKYEISYWLDRIKGLKISYWLDRIKGSKNLDEIKKQIDDRLNKIKGSGSSVDKIKKHINDRLDNIKSPDDIDEIKKQISNWVDKIKGLDSVDEITNQFLESDKIISELPFNLPKHTDQMYTSKFINTKQISKLLSKSIDIEIPEDVETLGDSKQIDLNISDC